MRHAWTVAQIRAAEEASGELASGRLMQRAADAIAAAVRRVAAGRAVVILAGPGNNGADGLWAGERLARAGVGVAACAVLGRVDDAAAEALRAAGGSFIDDAAALIGPRVVVDAIFGIGARPGLPPQAAELARLARDRDATVVAVDLPSGLDADGGAVPAAAFRATETVTFGGLRLCHLLRPAAEPCGAVTVADIGIDLDPAQARLMAWTGDDVAAAWPVPGVGDDKYSRGVLGIDTGSARYPGAAVLSCTGAAWSGAGMIRYVGPGEVGRAVVAALPNVTIGDGRVQAWLLGSGWGDRPGAAAAIEAALASGLPTVLDADAIAGLDGAAGRAVLITPHAGELARLLGVDRAEVEADPLSHGQRASDRAGATVLLKGANQYVFEPCRGQVGLAAPGPAWTGQAGSGDVLAGVCGTLLAAGLAPATAALAAASLQALAATEHPGPYPPQELARTFPAVLAGLGVGRSRRAAPQSTERSAEPPAGPGVFDPPMTPGGFIDPRTAYARIDLDALRGNLCAIADHVAPAEVMFVVKADGYGHGMVEVARAAREAGVPWLGVATPEEGLALRRAGDGGRILAWLYGDETDLADSVAAGLDLGVHRVDQLRRAITGSHPARVHLKVDTGLHRNGSPPADWAGLCAAAAAAERAGDAEVVAIWSHFARADRPGDPSIAAQAQAFARAEAIAREHGLNPPLRHLANSAAALTNREARLELVRVGIAAYGIDPADGSLAADAGVALRPVMSLRARLVAVKPVRAGESVSYGQTWTAPADTVLGLVPLGYGDGVPRAAGNRVSVLVDGRAAPIRGRVCMDQCVIDLGPGATERPGAEVVLFGEPGALAEEWARALDTIGYEIVTRIGPRVPRVGVSGGA